MTMSTQRAAFLDKSLPLEARTADLLSQLTLEEKVRLMAGAASFTLEGVERLGVPPVRVTDGPTGVRSYEGEPATVFPVGVAIASTWNPQLAREVGAAIAREALALDNRIVLRRRSTSSAPRSGAATSRPTRKTPTWPACWARPMSKACRARASAPR
jgi:hypothetical protein